MRQSVLMLALVLSGCAAGNSQPPVALVPSQLKPKADATMPPAWGITEVRVSAVVNEAGAVRDVAADCTLDSPYSSARFTAPARITVPDLGPQTPLLRIACSDGPRHGSAEVRAGLRSTNGGLGGWPAIGVSVGTGGYSGVSVGGFWGGGVGTTGPSVQQAVYPDVSVMLQ